MFIKENYRLHCEMRPFIRGYVHIYNYSDLSDFSKDHLENIIGQLLSCQSFDMKTFNELICFDEFIQGICFGYIKAEEMKIDLMERIIDVVWNDLNDWIISEYDQELRSQSNRNETPLHEILWKAEMRARANDINNSR